jgi:large subunit ribosomal protein L31
MKKNIHPKYQKVMFVDSATGQKYVVGTTLHPKQKETFDGVEYPVSHVSISSSSHPFFQGSECKLVDTEGRVSKFANRYKAAQAKVQATQEAAKEQEEAAQAAKTTAKKKKK